MGILMCTITKFNIQVNKDKVFDIINCRKRSTVYESRIISCLINIGED